MDTKNVTLFVFDEQENFEKTKKNNSIATEGVTIKKMIRIDDLKSFEENLKNLGNEDYISLAVHVFGTSEDLKGIKKFVTSQIGRKYSKLIPMYITDKQIDKEKIKHLCLELDLPVAEVYKYHGVLQHIEEDRYVHTKRGIMNDTRFEYAIIVALFEKEFEQLKTVFDFPEKEKIPFKTKTRGDDFEYRIGYLKTNKEKKVVAAVQRKTGMIDASIIATHMLELFKPKYLLMSGVCGGGEENKLGDVIVASEVFTFQRGKISDILQKSEDGQKKKINLYDNNGKEVDYEHLFDENGNQIKISVEKFEREPESINLLTNISERITANKEKIESEINLNIKSVFVNTTITIKQEPIACSTMVINKDGFFEDTIRVINRKTAAVEMESYGVARACHFANNGETVPIIFKSVMDFTSNKKDTEKGIDVKGFAAWTSAQFMKCLFEMDVI